MEKKSEDATLLSTKHGRYKKETSTIAVAGDDIETRKIGRDRITKAALVKNFRSQAFFFAQDSRQYVFGESDWSGVSLALKEAQNSQGTECVPAARSSLPTFHVEVD